MSKYFLLIFFLFLLQFGCAGSKKTVVQQSVVAESPIPNNEQDESFDPMTLGDINFKVTTTENSTVRVVTADELLKGDGMEKAPAESDEIAGFRVQLIATRDEAEAHAVTRNAVISFNEPVYREYDNPYYKIRLGDFNSRFEAAQLQEKAIQLGFHEAWVVRAMIKRSKLPPGTARTDE